MPDTNFYLTDHSRELLFDFIQYPFRNQFQY